MPLCRLLHDGQFIREENGDIMGFHRVVFPMHIPNAHYINRMIMNDVLYEVVDNPVDFDGHTVLVYQDLIEH